MIESKSDGKRKRAHSTTRKAKKTDDLERDSKKPSLPTDDENLRKLLTGEVDENSVTTNEKEVNKDIERNENGAKTGKDEENSELTGYTISEWMKPLSEAHARKMNITVLLENANLETVKHTGKSGGVVLLNCDDHRHLLKKTGREANDARPDITHQCLLALMDSPLNKAGRLKVYVRTAKNVLIEVHPQTRIPRTIKRFSGLIAELLEKFKVRGTSGSTPLLKVIRNPITSHLPVGTRKIVCTYNTDNIVDIRHHAGNMAKLVTENEETDIKNSTDMEETGETVNVLYVVGAMAHGKVTEDWADEYICVSEYPLSAATVCSRITYAYESLFGIV